MFLAASNALLQRKPFVLAQIGFLDVLDSTTANPPNPTVVEGDFLLRFAARTADNTVITVPGAWTVPPNGTISGAVGYGVVAYQFAGVGGSNTAGTWTNAQSIITYALRGVNVANPISDADGHYHPGSDTAILFDGLTLSATTDWVFAFARTANDIAASDHPPAGLIERVSASRRIAADSNGPASSYSGSSESYPGHGTMVTFTVAVKSV